MPEVVYVGLGDSLRQRLDQHLVKRDSSLTSGASAVVLNAEFVTEIRWWQSSAFADRTQLVAAELVAVFEPVLMSRGAVPAVAKQLAADPVFRQAMSSLFTGPAAGRLYLHRLESLQERIAELERRADLLEPRFEAPPDA
jgi:hypothetical protein